MRSTWLKIALGFGLLAAALEPAAACNYQPTSAANDQAPTTQTAQAQPAAENQSN